MGTIRRNGAANKKNASEAMKVPLIVLNQPTDACERAAPLPNILSNEVSQRKQYIRVLSGQI
jgi:hypothetical protein